MSTRHSRSKEHKTFSLIGSLIIIGVILGLFAVEANTNPQTQQCEVVDKWTRKHSKTIKTTCGNFSVSRSEFKNIAVGGTYELDTNGFVLKSVSDYRKVDG